MPDWTAGFERQTYSYYEVDPSTWRDRRPLRGVLSCNISRDASSDTLESASLSMVEDVEGEFYIRAYMETTQGGIDERTPMGTFLVQTPEEEADSTHAELSVSAFSPLLELADADLPIGWCVRAGQDPVAKAQQVCREKCRAPIVGDASGTALVEPFVPLPDDKAIATVKTLIAKDQMSLGLDAFGRISFVPRREAAALRPAWEFDDTSIRSIMLPRVRHRKDWYGVPNHVEVVYSSPAGYLIGSATNRGGNRLSVEGRGRVVPYRETSPDLPSDPTQADVDAEAARILHEKSTLEMQVEFEHAYCPVRLGDCVRVVKSNMGLDLMAVVTRQEISLVTGCTVRTTAAYTETGW